MESKIARAIKLKLEPVVVYKTQEMPQDAIHFKEGVWGCVIGMINAATKGKVVAFHEKEVVCHGGKAGLGFKPFEQGTIEYFLSIGGNGSKGAEHYKKNPELALNYIKELPQLRNSGYLVIKPLSLVVNEIPECIIFLVNPDQLSGLVTLSNYDISSQEGVKMLFGSGCVQSILNGLWANESNKKQCFIGLTDPSARKCINKDILSFTMPFNRYEELEKNVEESFLCTDTWQMLARRIN